MTCNQFKYPDTETHEGKLVIMTPYCYSTVQYSFTQSCFHHFRGHYIDLEIYPHSSHYFPNHNPVTLSQVFIMGTHNISICIFFLPHKFAFPCCCCFCMPVTCSGVCSGSAFSFLYQLVPLYSLALLSQTSGSGTFSSEAACVLCKALSTLTQVFWTMCLFLCVLAFLPHVNTVLVIEN